MTITKLLLILKSNIFQSIVFALFTIALWVGSWISTGTWNTLPGIIGLILIIFQVTLNLLQYLARTAFKNNTKVSTTLTEISEVMKQVETIGITVASTNAAVHSVLVPALSMANQVMENAPEAAASAEKEKENKE